MPKRSYGSTLISEESDDSLHSSASVANRKHRRHHRKEELSIHDKCSMIFDRLKKYKDKDDTLPFDMFWMIPLKRTSPEYYSVVMQPMDFATIQDRIKEEDYASLDDLQKDANLIFDNAKLYYGEGSEEDLAANQLREVFRQERSRVESVADVNTRTRDTIESASITSSMELRPMRRNKRIIVDETSSSSQTVESNQSVTVPLPSSPTKRRINALHSYFAVVAKYVTPEGRAVANSFGHLPSSKLYPQYYKIIRDPIDFRIIAQKILSGAYTSVNEIHCDFQLLVKNAKLFHPSRSDVSEDAVALARFAKKKLLDFDTGGKTRIGSRRYLPDALDIVQNYANTPDTSQLHEPQCDINLSKPSHDIEKGVEPGITLFDPRYHLSLLYDVVAHENESEAFMNLPSAKLYPQYYREIQSPLSLMIIRARIMNNSYKSIEELVNDFDILFTNAQVFNREESIVYKSAVKLQGMVHAKKEEIQNSLFQQRGNIHSTSMVSISQSPIQLQQQQQPQSLCQTPLQYSYQPGPMMSLLASPYESEICAPTVSNILPSFSQPNIHSPHSSHSSSTTPASSQTFPSSSIQTNISFEQKPSIMVRPQKSPQELLRQRFANIYCLVYNYQENENFLREYFLSLPSRESAPDYYSKIAKPLDLSIVKAKMDAGRYKTQEDLIADLRLMLSNANVYYPVGSKISNAAQTLDNVLKRRLRNMRPLSIGSTNNHNNCTSRTIKTSHNNIDDIINNCNNIITSSSPTNIVITNSNANISPTITPTNSNNVKSIATELFGANAACSPDVLKSKIEKRRMHELYLTVKEYREPGGRILSSPFMRLPSKQELPQYYDVILKPVELIVIGQKLSQDKYLCVDELMADLILMFENACHFNEPDSVIYKDALTLHRICLEKKALLMVEDEVLIAEGLVIGHQIIDIPGYVRDLLTRLFARLHNYEDEEGRCLSDSFVDVGPTANTNQSLYSVQSLDQVKRRLDAGCYRRLDRFQEDIFTVFQFIRAHSSLGSQIFEDACELQRVFIRLRDELTDHGKRLSSPAISYTDNMFREQLAQEMEKRYRNVEDEKMNNLLSNVVNNIHGEATPSSSMLDADEGIGGDMAEEGTEETAFQASHGGTRYLNHRGHTYHIHDFIYVTPINSSSRRNHIACITAINHSSEEQMNGFPASSSSSQSFISSTMPSGVGNSLSVTVNWFYRAEETFHMPNRKFLPNEVFKTGAIEHISVENIVGPCHVMWIKEYIKQKPKKMNEEDVYVCESQYSLKQQTFRKLKVWTESPSPSIELEDRVAPLVLQRESSVFVTGRTSSSPSKSFNNSKMSVLEVAKDCIVLQDNKDGSTGETAFEQVVFPSGFWVKLGDFVYLPSQDGKGRHIVRVDRLWHNHLQDIYYFSGPSFLRPSEVERLPARTFWEREVLLSDGEHATHILASALGKCHVLSMKEFCSFRPTEYLECDVYVCEAKYRLGEKLIRKMKSSLKKFRLSSKVCLDEIYFFSKPIVHRKESPLKEVSNTPIHMPQPVVVDKTPVPIPIPLQLQSPVKIEPIVDNGGSGGGAYSTPSTATKPSLSKKRVRKPPSAYLIYAAEQHKKLKPQRPEAQFGDLSREVGQMWRCLPDSEKKVFAHKAQELRVRMEKEEIGGASDATQQSIQFSSPSIPTSEVRPVQVFSVPSVPTVTTSSTPSTVMLVATPNDTAPTILQSSTATVYLQQTVSSSAPTCSYVMLPASQDAASFLTPQALPLTQQTSPIPIAVQPSQTPTSFPNLIVQSIPFSTNVVSAPPDTVQPLLQQITNSSQAQPVTYFLQPSQTTFAPTNTVTVTTCEAPSTTVTEPPTWPTIALQQGQVQPTISPSIFIQPVPVCSQFLEASAIQAPQVTVPANLSVASNLIASVIPCSSFVNSTTSSTSIISLPSVSSSISSSIVTPTAVSRTYVNASTQSPPMSSNLSLHAATNSTPSFVSVPPKPTKLFHSMAYSRYVNALRKGDKHVSNWPNQLSIKNNHVSSVQGSPVKDEIIDQFMLSHSWYPHHQTSNDAIWALRDHMLRDALNLRTKVFGWQ